MYEIRCLVPDKHLAFVLRALDAIAVEPPIVKPVDEDKASSINVVPGVAQIPKPRAYKKSRAGTGLKAAATKAKGVNLVSETIKFIQSNPHLDQISTSKIIEMSNALGYARGSQGWGINKLKTKGILTPTSQRGFYRIHREKLNEPNNSDVPNI